MNKIVREKYYQKLLEKCHKRHNKLKNDVVVEKSIDWNKLNKHFKLVNNGKS